MLEFLFPWAFLLLPLPLLFRRYLPAAAASGSALAVPLFEYQEFSIQANQSKRHQWAKSLLTIVWIGLVLAASRPVWTEDPVTRSESGRDLILAVDISGSMGEADMLIDASPASRIDALKLVVGRFIDRREGDRIGLILFGTNAYTFVPLTFDLGTLNELLQDVSTGLAGRRTAIGDAIGLAVRTMREQETEHKVLILVTDGSNTAGFGDPVQAALAARQEGLTIYTIGVGSDAEALGKIYGTQAIPPGTALNEALLKTVARVTQGEYFRAVDSVSLENIYQSLDQLEPVEYQHQSYQPRMERFHWALLPSIVILLFYLCLVSARRSSWNGFGSKP